MTGSLWIAAFGSARAAEKESDALVEDFVSAQEARKKRKREEREREIGSGGEGENGNGIDKKDGGFRQPKALARLHQEQEKAPRASVAATVANVSATIAEGTHKAATAPAKGEGRDMQQVLSRQICRQWLKHTFLNKCDGVATATRAGGDTVEKHAPCDDMTYAAAPLEGVPGLGLCGRLHCAPAKAALLHKDYSFKGLPKGQRKEILAQVAAAVGGAVVEEGEQQQHGGGKLRKKVN